VARRHASEDRRGRSAQCRPEEERMIASVAGRVAAVAPDGAVIEVGGVGFAVQCTPNTLAGLRVGSTARLATSLIVREDSLTLYGFADDDEKQLFEMLQTVSGVGPRVAQAVLAVHHPDAVRKAIANADTAVLVRVPGIGRKGAERLILELRDKIGSVPLLADGVPAVRGGRQAWHDQVHQALVGLGWSATQAEIAVAAVAEQVDGEMATGGPLPSVPALLKMAIRVAGAAHDGRVR
jgi:Holliday junction DNA helicase RuvA